MEGKLSMSQQCDKSRKTNGVLDYIKKGTMSRTSELTTSVEGHLTSDTSIDKLRKIKRRPGGP